MAKMDGSQGDRISAGARQCGGPVVAEPCVVLLDSQAAAGLLLPLCATILIRMECRCGHDEGEAEV